MKNKVQDGKRISYTEPNVAAVSAGDVVVAGALIGIASTDIPQAGTGELEVEGVFNVPKNTSEALSQGDTVILDVSTGEFRASDFTPGDDDIVDAGIVWADALAAAATVAVKINASGASVNPPAGP